MIDKPEDVVVASPSDDRRSAIARLVGAGGRKILEAPSLAAASALAEAAAPALVILQGFPVDSETLAYCRGAELTGARTIVICEHAELIDRIILLELGADDLLFEPVGDRLLLARIKAVLRRSGPDASQAQRPQAFEGGWKIDHVSREAIGPAGDRLALTRSEIALFHLFIANPNVRVDDGLATDRLGTAPGPAFRNAVSRLRRKLRSINGGIDPIRTVQGFGYTYSPVTT